MSLWIISIIVDVIMFYGVIAICLLAITLYSVYYKWDRTWKDIGYCFLVSFGWLGVLIRTFFLLHHHVKKEKCKFFVRSLKLGTGR